jgi:SAM-dependent methyltransferase
LTVTPRYLDYRQARRIYDRIGRWQDTRPLTERRAMDEIASRGDLYNAAALLEFGCGTGRFAARLLQTKLPAGAAYLGLDVSPMMVELAREALAPWGARARVELSDGSTKLPVGDGEFDRFVSTYVIDLLSPADAAGLLGEAHRALRPGGLLALASLTPGSTPPSRVLTSLWRGLWRIDPRAVGGCRPVELGTLLAPEHWRVRDQLLVTKWALSSEVLVAERL